jgi:hypothetical protein
MVWSEYLILENLKKGQFQLDTRRSEVIEETDYYCSEVVAPRNQHKKTLCQFCVNLCDSSWHL